MIHNEIRIIKRSTPTSSNSNKFFRVSLFVVIPLSVFIILAILFLRNAGRANAQVATFYSTTCLGGWKNTDKAIGAPEVTKGDTEKYDDTNSASISNATAQIFCGGFKGEIPTDTLQKKIVLNFSWTIENAFTEGEVVGETIPSVNNNLNIPESANAASVILTEEEAPQEEKEQITPPPETPVEIPSTIDEVPPEEEQVSPVEESQKDLETTPESLPEEPSPTEEQSFIRRLIPIAYAEEIKEATTATSSEKDITSSTESTVTDDVSSRTEITAPSNAILEVLYTLDGNNWNTIGYVSDITNDVSFEMPMDIFTTIADLERVQIAIRTVPTYDSVPTIYLDSVWLDVEYQKIPVTKGISGFKVFVLTQEKLEQEVNEWLSTQQNIIIDDLKVEDYGGGGYLVVVSYHAGNILSNSTARLKLIIGENPEIDAQTFLASLDSSQTVRSISAVAGSYSNVNTTITVPIIFIVYE